MTVDWVDRRLRGLQVLLLLLIRRVAMIRQSRELLRVAVPIGYRRVLQFMQL